MGRRGRAAHPKAGDLVGLDVMSGLGSFVWSIADQLRGVYKPHQYGGVILPFTILRRLDCWVRRMLRETRARQGGRVAAEPDGCVGRGRGRRSVDCDSVSSVDYEARASRSSATSHPSTSPGPHALEELLYTCEWLREGTSNSCQQHLEQSPKFASNIDQRRQATERHDASAVPIV